MGLRPLKIGHFVIDNPLLLAPMVGVSDSPFREICSASGAGLTVAEMLTCNVRLWDNDKNRLRQVKPNINGPQMVQIAGSDPGLMAEAAKLNQAMGADIIDINMGCPAKKVLRKDAGSALLRDPAQVKKILHAVVGAVDIPVTLKIRTGWCPLSRNGVEIAQLAQDAGVQLLTVHGRTRQCRFLGSAEYDTIAAIKRAISIPVIANGDITSVEKAKFVLEQTDVDGLMIGRAAQGNPWIFQQTSHFLNTGLALASPDPAEFFTLIHSHLLKIHDLYGDFKGVLFARKHVSSYLKKACGDIASEESNWRTFQQNFNLCTTPQQQLDALLCYSDFSIENKSEEIAA